MFPIINIFGRPIGSYALLAFLGFICCGAVAYFCCKKIKLQIEDIAILILVIAAGMLIGGHFLYGLVNLPSLINTLSAEKSLSLKFVFNAFVNCFGGMVYYGGFLGTIASLKVYSHYSKATFKNKIFDIYAFSIPLFHFFGRIGCFLAGCCYGIEAHFGFTVTGNALVPDINGVRRFPVSLLEAACNLIIFIILLTLFKKGRFKHSLLYLYMLLYSVVRFFTEFLRGDSARGIYFCFSTSQWISVFLFAFAAVKMLQYKKIPKKA